MSQQVQKTSSNWLDITQAELREILRPERNPEARVKRTLYIIGAIFSFLTVFGALFGFRRAYDRFFRNHEQLPLLNPLPRVTRAAMIIWGAAYPLIVIVSLYLLVFILRAIGPEFLQSKAFIIYVIVNLFFSFLAFVGFERWRADVFNQLVEEGRFGSARPATPEELEDLTRAKKGIYLGNNIYSYSKFGHLFLCAGARGGKGTNNLVPNLLGKSGYEGSWFVIDIKGELAAITARFQRAIGQMVHILDPWGLLGTPQSTYNPLDIFRDANEEHLSENADLIAEMIVPVNASSKDPFWDDKARVIVSGLIMHLVMAEPVETRSLAKIWQWLRYDEEKWAGLLADMAVSDNNIVAGVANDILNMKTNSDRMYGSIMAIVQSHTDFLKSPSLQKSLASSNFNINDLSKGRTTLYVVLPADKITSQSKWLRLVTTTALKSVVRNHDKRVTFLMDEFAALGYLPEVEIGMGAYAGYNITLFPVLQNLTQLKKHYKDSWETFLANAAVRTFFSVNDEFTMNYLSNMIGDKTVVTYEKTATGSKLHATQRKMFTPDEIRRGSANNIFLFVEQRPVTYFPKLPYYEMPELRGRDDDNPYMTPLNGNG